MLGSCSPPRLSRANARRSHHACDQCRKSKRACDAPQLAQPASTSSTSLLLLNQNLHAPVPKVGPCSYCAKTKKECTMNWAWSQLQIATALEAASRGEFRLDGGHISTKRQRHSPMEDHPQQQANVEQQSENDAIAAASNKAMELPISHFFHQDLPGDDPSATHKLPVSLPDEYPFDMSNLTADASTSGVHDAAFHVPSIEPLDPSADCLSGSLPPGLSCSSNSVSSHHAQPVPDLSLGVYPSLWQDTPSEFSQRSVISSTYSDGSGNVSDRRASKRRRVIQNWTGRPPSSLSPFSIDQSMMARSSNGFISANLLQIYHDVLEHNLSCWLTELTCPYKDSNGNPQRSGNQTEWGPLWSNRIYRRTLKLDQVAHSTNLIQISRSEDLAANRALNLAIMAFATQWAQGSRRQKERYSSPTDADNPLAESFDELAEEFDRNLQRHFWDQAQRALQDIADVESFKAVCAELVFGLAQKPWSQDETRPAAPEDRPTGRTGTGFEQESLMSEISRTISKDGPPIYLERAARKMHALKFRFDSATKGPAKGRRNRGGADAPSVMGDEDRATVGLLYWLAVMFDTVSSSMNERPVVVTDQDCQHEKAQQHDSGRWKVDLFIQDKIDAPCSAVHWPCTYEVAAEAVTKSGPVKVLLYRHLSYLQNVLRRGQHGQPVEEIIRSMTSLYRYWNMTHGTFFRELVQNFDYVPGRIRSWFVCISAHWHLAALMLADLIETVDEEDLGVSADSQRRLATKMVARIRETSVRELSDLARVSTPAGDEAGFMMEPQLPEFHHAVYEGTILTEPWTVILIRAFSRAAVLLLGEADDCRRYGLSTRQRSGDDIRDTTHQAEDCIKALFFLGKKSDMARRVADVLSGALSKLRPPQPSIYVA